MTQRQKISYYGIFIVLLGALFYCYEYFLRIAPSVMQNDLMRYFHLDATLFGSLSGFYFYAYSPMQLVVGVSVDRFKLKHVLTFAILCCALGSFIFATTPNYNWAAAGRFLQGFGSAFAFVGALKLASKWLPIWWFASFSGFCTALGFLGGASGDILLTHWVQIMGWKNLTHIFVITGVCLALIFWMVMSTGPAKKFSSVVEKNHFTIKKAVIQLYFLMKKPYMWCAGILGGLLFLPTIVFADLWGIPYLQQLHGYTLTQAGLMTSMIYFGWAIGSPLQGILSNMIGTRLRIVFWGALIAAILSLIVLYSSTISYNVLCVLFLCFGIASSVECLTFAMGRDVCTHQTTGMAMALINFLVMISGLFMQRGVGMLLDMNWNGAMQNGVRQYTTHDYQHAIVVVPISLGVAALMTLFVKDHPLKLHDDQI